MTICNVLRGRGPTVSMTAVQVMNKTTTWHTVSHAMAHTGAAAQATHLPPAKLVRIGGDVFEKHHKCIEVAYNTAGAHDALSFVATKYHLPR